MNREELIKYFRANEIWAKRSMGQNFLVDEIALDKIVDAAELSSKDVVIEIGPGLGVLTQELSVRAGKVIAIEKDDKLAEASKIKFQTTNVEVINKDALEFDPESYQLEDNSYKLVANIPYNITSLIIRKFLEVRNQPKLMVLMVQKEVAERMVAKPGDMSLLAVSVQFYADAEIVSIVPKDSFFPVPKVDSAIIKIEVKSKQREVKEKDFFRVVKFGFASKRKTLENNLSAGMHISKDRASDIIKRAGLSAKIRAEDLSITNWIDLYKNIEEGMGNGQGA